jgi:hypothetical protein
MLPGGKLMLYLFGSRARGDYRVDSDIDVIIDSHDDLSIVEQFSKYAIENGGVLDLFIHYGDVIVAAYSDWDRLLSPSIVWDCDYVGNMITEAQLESMCQEVERCLNSGPLLLMSI